MPLPSMALLLSQNLTSYKLLKLWMSVDIVSRAYRSGTKRNARIWTKQQGENSLPGFVRIKLVTSPTSVSLSWSWQKFWAYSNIASIISGCKHKNAAQGHHRHTKKSHSKGVCIRWRADNKEGVMLSDWSADYRAPEAHHQKKNASGMAD